MNIRKPACSAIIMLCAVMFAQCSQCTPMPRQHAPELKLVWEDPKPVSDWDLNHTSSDINYAFHVPSQEATYLLTSNGSGHTSLLIKAVENEEGTLNLEKVSLPPVTIESGTPFGYYHPCNIASASPTADIVFVAGRAQDQVLYAGRSRRSELDLWKWSGSSWESVSHQITVPETTSRVLGCGMHASGRDYALILAHQNDKISVIPYDPSGQLTDASESSEGAGSEPEPKVQKVEEGVWNQVSVGRTGPITEALALHPSSVLVANASGQLKCIHPDGSSTPDIGISQENNHVQLGALHHHSGQRRAFAAYKHTSSTPSGGGTLMFQLLDHKFSSCGDAALPPQKEDEDPIDHVYSLVVPFENHVYVLARSIKTNSQVCYRGRLCDPSEITAPTPSTENQPTA